MTRLTTIFTTVVVSTALVMPATAGAQATRRGGGSDSDSGGSSSSGSRGGSDGGGGSVAVPRNPSPQPSPSPRGEGGPAPSARPSGSRAPAGSDTRVAPQGSNRGSQDLRLRSAQASRGVAQPRGNARPGPREPLDYRSRWNPWYGYGPSSYYGYGYYGYSPFLYGGASWSWNRYGWHDPYLFDPYGYAGYAPYYWQSSGGISTDQDNGVPTGSLRLRVSPGHARVYVDGALAGIASEFGGLTNHLTIPAGPHQIELRADGFATLSVEVSVVAGRTRTERLGLKRLLDPQPGR